MNTRLREEIIGKKGDSIIVQRIIETEHLYICPNCPGSKGMVPINGIKAEALQALWHRSKAQGLGFFVLKRGLTLREAKDLLEWQTYFNYLYGKVMKVDLSGDEFDPRLYDRDNGIGAAYDAIMQLRFHPRKRDYVFTVWSETKPTGMECPRCGA